MDPGVEVAIIVAVASMASGFGSFISGMLIARSSRKERIEQRTADWARQDEVARKVSEAAEAAIESTRLQHVTVDQAEQAARLLKLNQDKVTQISEETLGTIRVVHTLVNSKLTGVTQRLLESQMAREALMDEAHIDQSDPKRVALQTEIDSLRLELDERAEAARGGRVNNKEANGK